MYLKYLLDGVPVDIQKKNCTLSKLWLRLSAVDQLQRGKKCKP